MTDDLKTREGCFVFGSNLRGNHGRGAAWLAKKKYGAIDGKGEGHMGNSYGLPTKDKNIRTMSLNEISYFVGNFLKYASEKPDIVFMVTRIGCGLAGYKDKDIAPMFKTAPQNCYFDTEWKPILGDEFNYWGTY